MPDWFYRTVSRSLLFRLSPAASRKVALGGVMGPLGRRQLGRLVIDFLGHMRPDPRLQQTCRDIVYASPVGIGCTVDSDGSATQALARFGVGFMEVGPITFAPQTADEPIERRVSQQALWLPDTPDSLGVEAWANKLAQPMGVPVLARLAVSPGITPQQAADQCRKMIARLRNDCRGFTLSLPHEWTMEQQRDYLQGVVATVPETDLSKLNLLLVCLPADCEAEQADALLETLAAVPRAGVLVEAATREGHGWLLGQPAREAALRLIRHLRQRCGDRFVLIGGGVHEPEDALALSNAGANLVLVDTGLIYSGPGLPKRINDILLWRGAMRKTAATEAQVPFTQTSWFWTTLLGISMFGGGLLALAIAATRVVLPYDEAFVGLSCAQLAAINPRLLPFLTHDRVSVAGTMIAVGVLYLQLSLYGVRRGLHWARLTILSSSFAGFGTFFLFLGFGYLEPFHAFVTAILFQFLLFALYSNLGERVIVGPPNRREDWRWRCNQWGQFLFVLHGVTLLTAGLTISFVGITHVFVHEDLLFMQTTADQLTAASPRLLPLIAHDRATFGGMLIATGITVLLSALWGFRQGDTWLWWGLLVGGGAAYTAAIGVHFAVGYVDWWHLLPAFGGAALLAFGLALSYPYLCGPSEGDSGANPADQ